VEMVELDYLKYERFSEPRKGDLLISEPFLPDPNFERTVILICEHNDEGSFGFVLNKPSMLRLEDVLEDSGAIDCPLYMGGPVQQDTLHFLHKYADDLEGSVKINEGIYWGGDFEQLKEKIRLGALVTSEPDKMAEDFRFFVGYSGWGPSQLEDELQDYSWIISRHEELSWLFSVKTEELWKNILKDMGGRYRVFANYPEDPRLN